MGRHFSALALFFGFWNFVDIGVNLVANFGRDIQESWLLASDGCGGIGIDY